MSRNSNKRIDGCGTLVALLFGLAAMFGSACFVIYKCASNRAYILMTIVIILYSIVIFVFVRAIVDRLISYKSGQADSMEMQDYEYRNAADLSQVDSLEGHDCEYMSAVDLSPVDSLEGHAFEYWCADLLESIGFTGVVVTRGSGDDGLDIIAYYGEEKWGIQCKRSNSKVGNKAIQEAYTGKALYNCQVAAVITNNYFTPSAVETANITQVQLLDRDWIVSMLS